MKTKLEANGIIIFTRPTRPGQTHSSLEDVLEPRLSSSSLHSLLFSSFLFLFLLSQDFKQFSPLIASQFLSSVSSIPQPSSSLTLNFLISFPTYYPLTICSSKTNVSNRASSALRRFTFLQVCGGVSKRHSCTRQCSPECSLVARPHNKNMKLTSKARAISNHLVLYKWKVRTGFRLRFSGSPQQRCAPLRHHLPPYTLVD